MVCVVVQLTTASRADAWFGWLDRLSGPGPFYSLDFEFRLACFGPRFEYVETLDSLLAKAGTQTLETFKDRRKLDGMKETWGAVAKQVAATNRPSAFPVLPPLDVAKFSDLVDKLTAEEVDKLQPNLFAANPTVDEALRMARINAVSAQAARFAAGIFKANTAINSIGSNLSFCGPTKTRRWAIALGASLGHANSNPQYAGGNSIRLISLVPSVSYRVFANPRFDAVDIGAGVGGYWITSRGFDQLRGIIVHPIRVDLHTPSAWVNSDGFESWLSMITFRLGFVVFPAGFDAGAFAATGDKAVPIGAEWTPRASVVVNLQTLIRRWKPPVGPPAGTP